MVARLEVWKPVIKNVNTDGEELAVFTPSYWVLCETHRDSSRNLRAGNPIIDLTISDKYMEARRATLTIANPIPNFQEVADIQEDESEHYAVYTHTWKDNRGVAIPGQPASGATRLRKNWGIYSYFFRKYQKVRIVDSVNHAVLFAGHIEDVVESVSDQQGTTFDLILQDELEQLNHTDLEGRWTTIYQKSDNSVVHRHEIIHHLLRSGMDGDVDQPEGFTWFGLKDKKDKDPTLNAVGSTFTHSNTHVAAGRKANGESFGILSNDNATSISQNHYKRFEHSESPVQDLDSAAIPITWDASKSTYVGIIGEIGEIAKSEPHHPLPTSDNEKVIADSAAGYSFFLDPDYARATNLTSNAAPPIPMFNYFRDGGRLSEIDNGNGVGRKSVKTHGLSLKWTPKKGTETHHRPASSQSPANAIRFMDRQSVFDNASENMFTTVALKYDGRGDVKSAEEADGKGKVEERSNTKVKQFEVIYCNYFDHASRQLARFLYGGKNFDDEAARADQGVAGTDSAEFLDFYHVHATNTDADGNPSIGAQVATGVARAQMQYMDIGEILTASETNKRKTPYDAVLVSDIKHTFPTTSDMNSADTAAGYVYLKGATSGTFCRFNPAASEAKEGRPSSVWEQQEVRNVVRTGKVNTNDIRMELINMLDQGATLQVYGDFMAHDGPFYYVDGTVRTATPTNNTGDGQTITIKATDTGTDAIDVSAYGFRNGMAVLKMDSTVGDGWTQVSQVSEQDIYGYSFGMSNSSTFKVNLTENQVFTASQSAGVGDHVRLVIPVRAGERVFVDNILQSFKYQQLEAVVLATDYTENPYPSTEWKVQGSDETRRRQYTNKRRPNSVSSYVMGGISGGSDGSVLKIAAGSVSNEFFGLNGNMGTGGTDKYVLYLDIDQDLEDATASSDTFNIYTERISEWERTPSMIVLGSVVAGDADTPASVYDGAQVEAQGAPEKVAAPNLIHGGTITGNLLVDGTVTAAKIEAGALQVGNEVTWVFGGGATPDMAIIPKSGSVAYNVSWDAGTIIHKPGSSSTTTYNITAGSSSYSSHHTNIFYGYIDPSESMTEIVITQNPFTWFDPNNIRIFSAFPSTAEETEVGISIVLANNQSITLGNGVIRTGALTADLIHGDAINGKVISLEAGGGGKFITNTGSSRDGNNPWFTGNGQGVLIDERGILGASAAGNLAARKAAVNFYLDATDGGKAHFGGFDTSNNAAATIDSGGILLGTGVARAAGTYQSMLKFRSDNLTTDGEYQVGHLDGVLTFFQELGNTHYRTIGFANPDWKIGTTGTPLEMVRTYSTSFKERTSDPADTPAGIFNVYVKDDVLKMKKDGTNGAVVTVGASATPSVLLTPTSPSESNGPNSHHDVQGGSDGIPDENDIRRYVACFDTDMSTLVGRKSHITIAGYDHTDGSMISFTTSLNTFEVPTSHIHMHAPIDFQNQRLEGMYRASASEPNLNFYEDTEWPDTGGGSGPYYKIDLDTGLYQPNGKNTYGIAAGGRVGITVDQEIPYSSTVNPYIGIRRNAISGTPIATSGSLLHDGAAFTTQASTHWVSTSDERIKTGITDITGAVDVIKQLRPVTFTHTDAWVEALQMESNPVQYGFIAQEFATVFPDFVQTHHHGLREIDGHWYMNYDQASASSNDIADVLHMDDSAVHAIVVKAIQDLAEEIEQLKTQISQLGG